MFIRKKQFKILELEKEQLKCRVDNLESRVMALHATEENTETATRKAEAEKAAAEARAALCDKFKAMSPLELEAYNRSINPVQMVVPYVPPVTTYYPYYGGRACW